MIAEITTTSSIPLFVTLGALIAGAAAGWNHIKGFFNWLKGLVIITVTIENRSALQNAIRLYCMKNFKEVTLGSRSFDSMFAKIHSIRKTQLVGFENLSNQGTVYWSGWKPVLMKQTVKKDGYQGPMSLIFIRRTFDVDQFITDSLNFYNKTVTDRSTQRHRVVYIFGKNKQQLELIAPISSGEGMVTNSYSGTLQDYTINNKFIGCDVQDLIPQKHQTPLSDLSLSKKASSMIELSKKWIRNENWFYEHHVPWRIGVLAYGEPGTGKTAMFRALAQELDLPVYVYDLASLSNEELLHNWRQMMANAPCMALMEDIDAVFEGRKNLTGIVGGLTFNSLLNCIDGVERSDGLFLAITTNNAKAIDPAIGVLNENGKIASRPGRIDYIVKMPILTKQGRIEIAKRILACCTENIEKIVKEGDGDTGAQFQERCCRFAMESFVNEKT